MNRDEVEKVVRNLLDRQVKSYTSHDINGIMSDIPENEEIVFIGSGVDEKFFHSDDLRKFYKRDISGTDAASIEINWLKTGGSEKIIWFAAGLTMEVVAHGHGGKVQARWTGVIEQRNAKWTLIQSHFSLPAVST